MNILFKCDQSNHIGSGHYYRCLALADVFKKKNHKCFFLGLKPGITKKNKISKNDEDDDLKFTQRFIKRNKIQLLIKDIYSLGYNWESIISKKNYLVVIGDYKDTKHYCNLYINYHFKWFEKKNYKFLLYNKCIKLIGPKYSIVRNINIKKKLKFKKKTIFIYMGGADKYMYMIKLANLLKNKKLNNIKKIFLLNNNHLKNHVFMKSLNKMVNIKILKNKTKNFHHYLASSNLSISPAGVTMLEQVALKSNSLIIAQNEMQKKTAITLHKANAINFVNNINSLNYKKIFQFLKHRNSKKKLINLQGKNLIYKKIISNYYKFTL